MEIGRKAAALTVLPAGLAFLGMIAGTPASGQEAASQVPPVQLAKHVILFIGDGMQLEHEIATSRYLHGRDFRLGFHSYPYRGQVSTWDVTTYNNYASDLGVPPYDPLTFDPLVGYDPRKGGGKPSPLEKVPEFSYFIPPFATDSASAATAWATGVKTDAGNIAWRQGDPPDGALKTIAELVREQKSMAIGVVSSVPFTHATPAAHVSHNVNRHKYHEIADEIIRDVQPDVVIGGGHPGLMPTNWEYMPSDLYYDMRRGLYPDYVFVERQAGVDGGTALLDAAANAVRHGKKLFGLFGGPGGNFESPAPVDAPGYPSVVRGSIENPWLEDATVAALEVLSQNNNGFVVMIEQGDIDWANHANDFQRMIGTTYDLDEAVDAAIGFVERPGDGINWDNTLLVVTSDHSNSYMRIVTPLGKGDLPTQVPTTSCPPGVYCGEFTYPDGEITYATGSHTNELVRLYARGKGAQLFDTYEGSWYPGTRIIDNTQIFRVMAQVLTLDVD